MPPNELTTLNPPLLKTLESTISFIDRKEEVDCRKLVESLTDDELEEAANASYSYYTSDNKDESQRFNMAMKMAKKYLIAEKYDSVKALLRMKNTLKYRKESKINDLRLIFSNPTKENELLRSQITSETSRQLMYVRGYDKQNHAILIKQDRTHPETDRESFFKTNIFMLERALACSELKSQEKIVVVLNYANYKRRNVPPIKFIKEFIGVMERNYPEVLAYLVLIDMPFYFRGIWYVIKPFIDPDTVRKIRFVTGVEQKVELLGPLIDEDQAMPFLLPDGKLSSSVDMSYFLNEVPFHCDYDKK